MTNETIALVIVSAIAAALAVACVVLSAMAARARAEGNARAREAAERRAALDRASAALREAEARVGVLEVDLAALRTTLAERETQASRDREEFRAQLDAHLKDLTAKALDESSARLLSLADERFARQHTESKAALDQRTLAIDQLIKPIRETLVRTDTKLTEIDRARAEAFASLDQRIQWLGLSGKELRDETRRLVAALSRPHVRGAWGELTLRRVAEIAGMKEHVDFDEQDSREAADGRTLRPDMIVTLPNDRRVVVDAKANTEPYMQAIATEDREERDRLLERFAQGVLDQALKLSRKGYWAEYDGAADFVVMFIPGEQFLDAALERRPQLVEFMAAHNIIVASPSSLIGLLRAVQIGWRESELSDRADELFALGRELHERGAVFLEHMTKLGVNIDRTVRAYNDMVGSVESRLGVTLRKFEDVGAKSSKPLAEPKHIERAPTPPMIGEREP